MEGSLKKLLFFGTFSIIMKITQQTGSMYYIHKYILITHLEMSWTEAQSYCRAEYGDLATIFDEQDFTRINDMTSDLDRPFWIGLYDDINSWKWSLVGEDFYADVGDDYRKWQEDQPDNVGADERCVSMTQNGFWRDNSCTVVKMPLICFTVDEEDQYVLVTEQKSWFEAQSYCRQHHTDLVSVRSLAENQEVSSRLQTGQEAWIGMHRDSWEWSDGSSSLFRKWREDQPDNENNTQACVGMQKKGWSDSKCANKLNILCQEITEVTPVPAVQRRTTVKVKLLTKADLTDPTIRHNVLQQFEAALHSQGFTDVKLLWRTLKEEPQPTESDACGEELTKNLG
ncbi:C-type mannose receptor 2-like isoform X1 [Dicentrarchus labrax]|uniref:C-type mannose receptor 2-like isoform X1 n=1 Tax=Dicentrarchus labrax TaxID=13489 RepID=UPI0021F5C441|nr:C-type mannose receptor 2-like isoform X1 [Dicentrarchus labrax]XP_051256958.1 C-type mannose receptor 2-like isoform X2 [Dicentrarchus labrax]XP_051256959.1 C-type mannose receptor 2-like isoform X1 [Dicentrarchus labrax]